MDIFNYQDYRLFLKDFFNTQNMISQKEIANAMAISPSLLSQILHGDRELSSDQAYKFAVHNNFRSAETAYWLMLLEYSKAASTDLKLFFEERLKIAAEEFRTNERVRLDLKKVAWSQEFISIFYSSWQNVAVYCVMGLKEKWTAHELSERLNLELSRIHHILEFFLTYEIIRKLDSATVTLNQTGYVALAGIDHNLHRAAALHNCKNFRLKAMDTYEKHQFIKDLDPVFLTVTALISEKDYNDLRKEIKTLVESLHSKIHQEQYEDLVCLNVDLFKI